MELRHLRYFICVAEEEHIGRAAERLHISQSPLSRQIQRLETELDLQLFYREGRGVQLTPVGRDAYAIARSLIMEAEHAKSKLSALKEGEIGLVRVGYVQGATYNRALPETLVRLKALAPGVELALLPMRSKEQIKAVLNRELEVGFIHSHIEKENIEYRRIHSERFVLLCNEKYAERISSVSAETLESLPWILLPRTAPLGSRTHHNSVIAELGILPKVVTEVTDISAALSFVASGLGVTVVQESIARVVPSGVVTKELPALDTRIDTAVIWHREHISPATQLLIQALPEKL